jgi:hypothetical protein
MPEEEPIERARADEREGKSPSTQGASLCAKKWNTFGKANAAPDRQSKQLPLVSPKRGGPE